MKRFNRSWDPDEEIRSRSHITLVEDESIPGDSAGLFLRLDDGAVIIAIRPGLDGSTRRLALTHELAHDEFIRSARLYELLNTLDAKMAVWANTLIDRNITSRASAQIYRSTMSEQFAERRSLELIAPRSELLEWALTEIGDGRPVRPDELYGYVGRSHDFAILAIRQLRPWWRKATTPRNGLQRLAETSLSFRKYLTRFAWFHTLDKGHDTLAAFYVTELQVFADTWNADISPELDVDFGGTLSKWWIGLVSTFDAWREILRGTPGIRRHSAGEHEPAN
jgi:hypothetical protein